MTSEESDGVVTAMELAERFRRPPVECRPMIRWWWPGGDVDDDELRRELGLMDDAGFGGVEIQPLRMNLPVDVDPDIERRVDSYLTPGFFGHVRAVVEEATLRGMWVDFTFGSGWPFGGPHITPEASSKDLISTHRRLEGPTRYRGQVPWPDPPPPRHRSPVTFGRPEPPADGWQERLDGLRRLVCVVAVRGSEPQIEDGQASRIFGMPRAIVSRSGRIEPETAVVLTDRVGPDGMLDWEVPDGEWLLFAFVQHPGDLLVAGGVGRGPRLVLDHFDAAGIEAHIAAVGEGLRQHLGDLFGRGLRAVFCDSLEVEANLYWSDHFLEEFQRRRGYDLAPLLPLVKIPGVGDRFEPYDNLPPFEAEGVGSGVRDDYWLTVSDLMIDNFFLPFTEWAEANGLLARIQAHGSPADVLRIYGLVSVGETENLYATDRYDFFKLAASARHVYGGKLTTSESFVWPGLDYRATPELWKRLTDKMLTAGVNQVIWSGFPYEYMDRPEPGWYPFQAPLSFASHVNHHDTFWTYVPLLNAYISRLQMLAQAGEASATVLVYRGRLSYPKTADLEIEPQINRVLLGAGFGFDHINAHALVLTDSDGHVAVVPSGRRYEAIVVHGDDRLPVAVVERLTALARAGVLVVFIGAISGHEPGHAHQHDKTAQIAQLVEELRTTAVFVARADDVREVLETRITPDVRFDTPVESLSFIRWRIGRVTAYLVANHEAASVTVGAWLPVAGGAQRWDAWDGSIHELGDAQAEGSGTRVSLLLPPYGSTLVVIDPDGPRPHATVDSALGTSGTERALTIRPLDGLRWRIRGSDGRPGGVDVDVTLSELIDWSSHPDLRRFSGTARYTTSFWVDGEDASPDRRVVLDIGEVLDVAEVTVNGVIVGTRLLRPYEFEMTHAIHAGNNQLEIAVTNTLANRLLGEGRQLGIIYNWVVHEPTFAPSGLLGPLRLLVIDEKGGA